jgi:hypothetical protein
MTTSEQQREGDEHRNVDGLDLGSTSAKSPNVSHRRPNPDLSAPSGKSAEAPDHNTVADTTESLSSGFIRHQFDDAPNSQHRRVREDLLEQFYCTLRAGYLSAEKEKPETREIHQRIRAGLNGEPSWVGAYEVEQLLTFVMTREQLATEISRRMGEAEELDLPFVPRLAKQLGEAQALLTDKDRDAAAEDRAWNTIRYVLHRLLNDLQWFYKQRIRRRDAAMRLSLRVGALFFTALAYFFALLFVQFFAHNPSQDATSGIEGEQPVQREISRGAEQPGSPVLSE